MCYGTQAAGTSFMAIGMERAGSSVPQLWPSCKVKGMSDMAQADPGSPTNQVGGPTGNA